MPTPGIGNYNAASTPIGVLILDATTGEPSGGLSVTGPSASGAAAVGNPLGVGGTYIANPTLDAGDRSELLLSPSGQLQVQLTSSSGSPASISTAAGADAQSNTTNVLQVRNYGEQWNGSTWDRDVLPNAVARIISAAATTNASTAKASAGKLFSISGYNAAATVRWLKVYNKASNPTVGTDTPVLSLPLLPTTAFNFTYHKGLHFATGIAFALTTGSADSDTGALTLADVLGLNLAYA